MAYKYWVDKKRLKDPMFWFMKASYFSSASEYLMNELSKYDTKDLFNIPPVLVNAIQTIPYLTGLACELFMKGYLVHKGESPDNLRERKIAHNLKVLREMCLKFGDKRFIDDNLTFLTDTLGEHLMEDGGIRYPDKYNMAIYSNEFERVLKLLQEITGEISMKLTKPSEGFALLR